MTTQDILTRVNELVKVIDATPHAPTACELAHSLANDLAAQVRSDIARMAGTGNAKRAAEAILKAAKADHRDRLAYPWVDKRGKQCVCDGFVAFRLDDPLPLPERPKTIPEDGIDLDKVFPESTSNYMRLPLPKYADLKAYIAMERAENGRKKDPLWDFGEGNPVVNACYLLNLLAIFPDATEIKCQPTAARMVAPLYISGANGEAILLPVRNPDKINVMKEHEREELSRQQTAKRFVGTLRTAIENGMSGPHSVGYVDVSIEEFATAIDVIEPAA